MATSFKLDWKGPGVKRSVLEATRMGIDETMTQAVAAAKPKYYHGHGLVTGVLQGSIRAEPAQIRGDKVSGRWGSFDVRYALFVEIGRKGRAGQKQLRTAADQTYPNLEGNIRKHVGK